MRLRHGFTGIEIVVLAVLIVGLITGSVLVQRKQSQNIASHAAGPCKVCSLGKCIATGNPECLNSANQCAGDAKCPKPTPLPATCSSGQTRCNGNNESQVCSSGTWRHNQNCNYGCANGSCITPPPPPVCNGTCVGASSCVAAGRTNGNGSCGNGPVICCGTLLPTPTPTLMPTPPTCKGTCVGVYSCDSAGRYPAEGSCGGGPLSCCGDLKPTPLPTPTPTPPIYTCGQELSTEKCVDVGSRCDRPASGKTCPSSKYCCSQEIIAPYCKPEMYRICDAEGGKMCEPTSGGGRCVPKPNKCDPGSVICIDGITPGVCNPSVGYIAQPHCDSGWICRSGQCVSAAAPTPVPTLNPTIFSALENQTSPQLSGTQTFGGTTTYGVNSGTPYAQGNGLYAGSCYGPAGSCPEDAVIVALGGGLAGGSAAGLYAAGPALAAYGGVYGTAAITAVPGGAAALQLLSNPTVQTGLAVTGQAATVGTIAIQDQKCSQGDYQACQTAQDLRVGAFAGYTAEAWNVTNAIPQKGSVVSRATDSLNSTLNKAIDNISLEVNLGPGGSADIGQAISEYKISVAKQIGKDLGNQYKYYDVPLEEVSNLREQVGGGLLPKNTVDQVNVKYGGINCQLFTDLACARLNQEGIEAKPVTVFDVNDLFPKVIQNLDGTSTFVSTKIGTHSIVAVENLGYLEPQNGLFFPTDNALQEYYAKLLNTSIESIRLKFR